MSQRTKPSIVAIHTDAQRLEVSVFATLIRIMREDAYLDDEVVGKVARLAMDDRIFSEEQRAAVEELLGADLSDAPIVGTDTAATEAAYDRAFGGFLDGPKEKGARR